MLMQTIPNSHKLSPIPFLYFHHHLFLVERSLRKKQHLVFRFLADSASVSSAVFPELPISVAVFAESRGLCLTPHHLLPSSRAQKVKMRQGRETAEIQATEFVPAQAGGGPIPCFLKLPRASWQVWKMLCGVLASRFWGKLFKKISGSLFSRGGTLKKYRGAS